MLAAHAHREDRDELNKVCQSAMDAAAAGAAAGVGTALHKLTERLDRGQPLDVGMVPNGYAADIRAYERAMSAFEVVAVEQFTVCDELKVGGTPDLVVRYHDELFIADKKTGSIEWGAGKMAMQLAMYSRSVAYALVDGEPVRAVFPPINQDRGIIIHLPAGEGRCELRWVDIGAGWRDIGIATAVREHRARKSWLTPLNVEAAVATISGAGFEVEPISLLEQITHCETVPELHGLYHETNEQWTDEHVAAAAERKRLINARKPPRRHQALRALR